MNIGRYIFSLVVDFIPRYQFDKAVTKYRGIYEDFHQYQSGCMGIGEI